MVEDSRALIERLVGILERGSRSLQELAKETAALANEQQEPTPEKARIVMPRRIP